MGRSGGGLRRSDNWHGSRKLREANGGSEHPVAAAAVSPAAGVHRGRSGSWCDAIHFLRFEP